MHLWSMIYSYCQCSCSRCLASLYRRCILLIDLWSWKKKLLSKLQPALHNTSSMLEVRPYQLLINKSNLHNKKIMYRFQANVVCLPICEIWVSCKLMSRINCSKMTRAQAFILLVDFGLQMDILETIFLIASKKVNEDKATWATNSTSITRFRTSHAFIRAYIEIDFRVIACIHDD